ncbi:MAG: hypothetical protein K9L30_09670 [Desulfobacterales bacterium]|nr:hypothetical protein [Desulfobacterales bacterium]
MTEETYDYDVRCRTCRTIFKVQLFDSHDKNLFVAAKKDWYCEKCKKAYFSKQTEELTKAHKEIGLPELTGTRKMISWGVKVRGELINKVKYLQQSLSFINDEEKELSEKAFERFFKEWQEQTVAKWWVDNRKMNVRDISIRIKEITENLKKN